MNPLHQNAEKAAEPSFHTPPPVRQRLRRLDRTDAQVDQVSSDFNRMSLQADHVGAGYFSTSAFSPVASGRGDALASDEKEKEKVKEEEAVFVGDKPTELELYRKRLRRKRTVINFKSGCDESGSQNARTLPIAIPSARKAVTPPAAATVTRPKVIRSAKSESDLRSLPRDAGVLSQMGIKFQPIRRSPLSFAGSVAAQTSPVGKISPSRENSTSPMDIPSKSQKRQDKGSVETYSVGAPNESEAHLEKFSRERAAQKKQRISNQPLAIKRLLQMLKPLARKETDGKVLKKILR